MKHITYENTAAILEDLVTRYPALLPVKADINALFLLISDAYHHGNKLLICGNGGSASDALHIVGELMKSFTLRREISPDIRENLEEDYGEEGAALARSLEGTLPAIALVENASLSTAFANDVDGTLAFAQQVYGLGKTGDVLLCISTSGNAKNCIQAAMTAKAMGMKVGFLSGKDGGKLLSLSDAAVVVPSNETFMIQELHLPVYHALCLMLEYEFFA